MDALTPASSRLSLGVGCFLSAAPPRESLLFCPPPTTSLAPPSPFHLSHRAPHPLGASRPFRPSPLSPVHYGRRSPRRRHAAPSLFHRKASTGYAAALLDAARCDGAVAAVERDVRRFSWAVRAAMGDPFMGEEVKGEALVRTVEGGGFYSHLVALVKMLVGKGKLAMVAEVMEEFGRIYDELTGTRAVLVSSEERMTPEQLAGIAERVRRASGAAKIFIGIYVRSLGDKSYHQGEDQSNIKGRSRSTSPLHFLPPHTKGSTSKPKWRRSTQAQTITRVVYKPVDHHNQPKDQVLLNS